MVWSVSLDEQLVELGTEIDRHPRHWQTITTPLKINMEHNHGGLEGMDATF